MSSLSPLHSLTSIYKPTHSQLTHQNPSSFSLHLNKNSILTHKYSIFRGTLMPKLSLVRSSFEEEPAQDQTVAVPASPSDKLLMFFQAEGTMSDSAIPAVTQALEGANGISDLKIYYSEGIASVELTKQTTIQATGVASVLVELIQGAGFKLQTLNLSFEEQLVTA